MSRRGEVARPPAPEPLATVAGQLAALAEREGDREVCGLVVAGAGGALAVWPMPNGAPDPASAYLIPPAALLAALRRLDREERSLAAVYHSHPRGGAELSASDLEVALAAGAPVLPGVGHLVVALERGRAVRVRLHRFQDGRFQGSDLWPQPPRPG